MVTVSLGAVAVIHTILDTSLYFKIKLKPLYVLVLACILMVFWLGNIITEAIELVSITQWGDDTWDSLGIVKGRVALSFCIL